MKRLEIPLKGKIIMLKYRNNVVGSSGVAIWGCQTVARAKHAQHTLRQSNYPRHGEIQFLS